MSTFLNDSCSLKGRSGISAIGIAVFFLPLLWPAAEGVGMSMGKGTSLAWEKTSEKMENGLSKARDRGVAAPARDGDIAIRKEFEFLKKQGTREAMELFILRHPNHPLVAKAKKILRRLEKSGGETGKAPR